jgi:hypothetical protein
MRLGGIHGVGRVMPSFVYEMGIARDRINFAADFFELVIGVSEVFQLGRADKGEVGWVEEKYRPFAQHVGLANLLKLSVCKRLNLKIYDLFVDL